MKISKRKDGRWRTQIKTPDGKYKSVYGKTKKECQQKANVLIAEIETKNFVNKNNITLKEWIEVWLKDYTGNLKVSTYRSYQNVIKRYIFTWFGDMKIQSITPQVIQNFISDISKNLSPYTTELVHVILKRCLGDAERSGIIASNPAKGAILPKREIKEMEILNEHEIPLFVEKLYSSNIPYADLLEFILLTGLRVREALGLTESRYDRDNAMILIDRQLAEKKCDGLFTSPKRDKARTVAVPDRAVEIIENRIAGTLEHKKSNPLFNPEGFIFYNEKKNGTAICYTTLFHQFKKVAKMIGKDNLRIHDLRHTYATMAIKAGMDIKTLQTQLGHSNAGFTLQKYGHSTNDMKKEGAQLLGQLFEKIGKK